MVGRTSTFYNANIHFNPLTHRGFLVNEKGENAGRPANGAGSMEGLRVRSFGSGSLLPDMQRFATFPRNPRPCRQPLPVDPVGRRCSAPPIGRRTVERRPEETAGQATEPRARGSPSPTGGNHPFPRGPPVSCSPLLFFRRSPCIPGPIGCAGQPSATPGPWGEAPGCL